MSKLIPKQPQPNKKQKVSFGSNKTDISQNILSENDTFDERILNNGSQGGLTPEAVVQLQRTLGNSAINNLLSGGESQSIHRQVTPEKRNKTGLPDHLKSNVEQMSGIAMDDVAVHYNSREPERVGAAAYTEGSDIHIGAGQESYLPHEAWHVVQQKQGRVTPSIQMKSFSANLNTALEHEADVMGEKANQQSLASRFPSQSQVAQSQHVLGQTLAQRTATPVRQYGGCKGSGGSKSKKSEIPEGTEIDEPKEGLLMTKDHWAKGWTARNVGVIDNIAKNDALLKIADEGEVIDVELAMKAENMLHDQGLALTETKKVQTYYIKDTNKKFYTATTKETATLIQENGLDPQYGGTRNEGTHTAFNSVGHVYFGLDKGPAQGYGMAEIGRKNMAIIEFTLPDGHPITVDPEVSTGDNTTALRTNKLIPPNLVNVI